MISVGALRLHDPTESDASCTALETDAAEPVGIEELREIARETEIDFAELAANVNATFAASGPVTVAQVLEQFAATQGVASVVGLLALAAEQGVVGEEPEVVEWDGVDGTHRRAQVPQHRFVGSIDD